MTRLPIPLTVFTASFQPTSSSQYDWEVRYAGYRLDLDSSLYQVRHRVFHSAIGAWLTQHPRGYKQSDVNLTQYVESRPTVFIDSFGLQAARLLPIGMVVVGSSLAIRAVIGPLQPPLPTKFRVCQRDLIETDCYDRCGNKIGGKHNYVQFGELNDDGTPVEGTEGWGWGPGKAGELPKPEGSFHPTSCSKLYRSRRHRLAYGVAAGKLGLDATDEEILDCVKNHPARHNYDTCCYNCKDWAWGAVRACGLTPNSNGDSGGVVL